eukprot:TRINITY_DN5221_c0_g2_i1.p1 TRINITY_DN5221_c0_g2~~TRINITY_DN5221_c0_g2_i1.p1  ORF type:complete len:354 (+),score=92.56 TRINITY_DN5221_c0_g2_i1:75-1136(+)
MIRRPPRSTLSSSSAASDVYKRQVSTQSTGVAARTMDRVGILASHLEDSVEATVLYYSPEEEASASPSNTIRCPKRILNGRGRAHSLQDHGFELRSLPFERLQGVDLYDPVQMHAHMYPLATQVLQGCFPQCSSVLVFDHILRNSARHQQEQRSEHKTPLLATGPAFNVHGDYTVRSGFTRAQQLLAPHESEERIAQALQQRFAFVNVWVPLAAVQKDPLGLIEWGSQSPQDVNTVRFIYKHRQGEIYHALPSEQHRWVYYPAMQPGECLAFKVFDSSEEAARFSLHAAFKDPSAASDAPERQSVELRCMVLMGELPQGFAAGFVAPHLQAGSPDQELSPERAEVLRNLHGEW